MNKEKIKEIYSKYHAREISAEDAIDELELVIAEASEVEVEVVEHFHLWQIHEGIAECVTCGQIEIAGKEVK